MLGNLISFEKIDAGLTNEIYKVRTDKDTYCIKIINPNNIKNNPNHLANLEMGENISSIAEKNGINTICAINYNNHYVLNCDDIYFLIFKWFDGKVLLSKELNNDHMEKLALMLAKLHSIKVDTNYKLEKYSKNDYKYYYDLLKDSNDDWAQYYKDNYEKIIKIYNEVYDNYLKLSNQVSYVHNDLNRKNVLWKDNLAYIIDFETASISNPSLDFFNSLWFLTDDFKDEKVITFTRTYLAHMKLKDDFSISLHAAIIYELNWLLYSLKRALKINTNNPEEISMGRESIKSSIKEIINYYDKIPFLLKLLEKEEIL